MKERKGIFSTKDERNFWLGALFGVVVCVVITITAFHFFPELSEKANASAVQEAPTLMQGIIFAESEDSDYLISPTEYTWDMEIDKYYSLKLKQTELSTRVKIYNEEPISHGNITFRKGEDCILRERPIVKPVKPASDGYGWFVEYQSPAGTEFGLWCPSGAILRLK